MRRRTVVIGSGISGLVTALELYRAGRDVVVLEARRRLGGCISTVDDRGYTFEVGPNSFPSSATSLIGMAKSVGLESHFVEAAEAAKLRLLYIDGKLLPVPMSPKQFLKSKVFSWPEKLRVLREPFVPRRKNTTESESVADFFVRRFGLALTKTVVDAFVCGIYAGDARRLGVQAAFPSLVKMEQEHGSIFKAMKARGKSQAGGASMPKIMSFCGGMSEFVDALAKSLDGCIYNESKVKRLTRPDESTFRLTVEARDGTREEIDADEVVVATAPPVAGQLLAEICPMASDLVFDVPSAPIVSIHAGFDAESLPTLPGAFGFLVPRPQRMRTLGWLFSSTIFPGRAPEGKIALTGYIGGANDPHIVKATPESVRHIVLGELSLALRMKTMPKPEYFAIHPHMPGIPQHAPGHERRMPAVRKLLTLVPGLQLVGNYVGGISLEECVKTARAAAHDLVEGAAPATPMEAVS